MRAAWRGVDLKRAQGERWEPGLSEVSEEAGEPQTGILWMSLSQQVANAIGVLAVVAR